jgi:D-alanyl-D-alanine carboxypeptidase (penicillin-binding protein 5/6)
VKKIIIIFLLCFTTKVCALDLTSYSRSAILVEPSTNTIIYELNKDEKLAPASMTKLMTMLLIMEAVDDERISLNDMVLVSKNAASMGGSQVFLEENSKLKVDQLLKGIAIASGNDAAVAMAEHIAGSTQEFVNMMNQKAEYLNLKNTHFVNVHGLDEENHYSTAYDMSQIAIELLKYDKILEYTSLYEDYLEKPDGTKTWLVNTNKLVRFYEGVDGLKTGYTKNAMYCLTSTAMKNNVRFVSVVMGADSSEHRSQDTTNMLNYGFSNYKLNKILNANDDIGQIDVYKGKKKTVKVVTKEGATDLLKQNERKTYSYNVNKYKLTAPVFKGDVVGQLEIVDNNGKVVKILDIISGEDVEKHNFVSLLIDFLRNNIGGYV